MIIPLNKLLTHAENRYLFTRAAMSAVDKIGNMKSYPTRDKNWKVVPNLLKLMLDENLKFEVTELEDEEK